MTYGSSGLRTATCMLKPSRMVLGKPAKEGESPVHERPRQLAESRVLRDTWNPAGSGRDHPPSLNTTW